MAAARSALGWYRPRTGVPGTLGAESEGWRKRLTIFDRGRQPKGRELKRVLYNVKHVPGRTLPDPSPHPARSEQLGREQPDRGEGGEELLLQPLPPALRQSHLVIGTAPFEGLRIERRLGALVLLGAAGGVPLGHRRKP